MQHLLSFAPQEDEKLLLPALDVGPIPFAIGHLRHVLAPKREFVVEGTAEVAITARSKETAYRLVDGPTVIVTDRRQLVRPPDIDGVLRRDRGGTLTWLSHRLMDELQADVAARGWPAIASEIAKSWDGKFTLT